METFSLPKNSLVILYAPTFRANFNPQIISFDWLKLKNSIRMYLKKDAVLLVRLHPNIATEVSKLEFKFNCSDCINVTNYDNMQDLLISADILITDYSSSMFDFALMKKLCIIFAKDKRDYDRGFYIDFENLPFTTTKSDDELEKAILAFSENEYLKSLQEFNERIGVKDNGHACMEVYNWINNNIN